MRTEGIEYYLFDTDGTRLGVPFPEKNSPIEPEQVEGILAAAGSFEEPKRPPASEPGVTRARYDGYRLIGVRGSRGVLAAVYPDSLEGPPLEELHHMLRRLEGRLPSRALAREHADPDTHRGKRRVPWRRIRRDAGASG